MTGNRVVSAPRGTNTGLRLVSAGSAWVDRPRLLRKLDEAATPVILLNAPSGYGKSVLLTQWAERDSRPFASIILGDEHNDPARLLASIVEALDEIEPVPSNVSAALAGPEPNIDGAALPRLGRVLAERQASFVLVLDDLERLESPQSLHAVSAIGTHLARDSQLVVATRTEPALPIGRLRAHRELTEFGRSDLLMTKTECGALLAGLDLSLSPRQLDSLVRHTEGWPAALYLAGLALSEEPDLGKGIARFAGDDRVVVDYIRDEFLDSLSRRRLEFLRRASVLDRLSGDVCDAVLGRTGSATVLRDLSRSNMLLMAMDRRDEWFRFHALFGEMLRSELHRMEPGEEVGLHRRASDWWAEHDDLDRAIHHAIEGGAFARAGELLWSGVPDYMSRGRNATVMRWLDRLGDDTVSSDPALSLTAAVSQVTRGAGALAEHWAAVSRGLLQKMRPTAKTRPLTSGLSLVEAALARDGVEAMSAHTTTAAEQLPDESPWLSMCFLIDGVGLHLRGFRRDAHDALAEGARRGAVGAPNIQVLCLAQLALLAIDEDDWQLAEMLASQGRSQVDRSGLGDYSMMALGVAVSALVRSHSGKAEKAAADLRLATRLLEGLDEFAPWFEAETRIVLARAAGRLDDAATAKLLLHDAARLLKLTPDATVLGEWIEQAAAMVETVSVSAVKDLTPAELRVLEFLPTHLSFAKIAARVQVSPNTIKTQAQSVYRKLGVSSRLEAVEHARSAGLLDDERSGPGRSEL